MVLRLSCTNQSIYRPRTCMHARSYLSTFYQIRHQPTYMHAVHATQGSDLKSKGDKLSSFVIRGFEPGRLKHPLTSRHNSHSQIDSAITDQYRCMRSKIIGTNNRWVLVRSVIRQNASINTIYHVHTSANLKKMFILGPNYIVSVIST